MCSRGLLYLRNSNSKESGHLTWFEGPCDGTSVEAGSLGLPGLECGLLLGEGPLKVGALLWRPWFEGPSSVWLRGLWL